MYQNSLLGKATTYYDQYKPDLLFEIPRSQNRDSINVINTDLPFTGFDVWNGYEFSWLDNDGMPQARKIRITISCDTTNLFESKSFKLYLYSFANTKFDTEQDVVQTLASDLHAKVELLPMECDNIIYPGFPGVCLDSLDIRCDTYHVDPSFLVCSKGEVCEQVWSNLLKSNCLVTGAPDWATVSITYTGNQINHKGLLKYIISFREHMEFHEHCVERMFIDILRHCKPTQLHVEARFTRRGGLDINPVRAIKLDFENHRMYRQ